METLARASAAMTAAAPTLCTKMVPDKDILTMADTTACAIVANTIVCQVRCPTGRPFNARALSSPDGAAAASLDPHDSSTDTRFSDFRDPFYASTFPVCYALAATTVTAYMLLIMLFITPRSFLDGGVVYLGRRRGFTHSSSGGENIGGRPWLQKVAALTVAVSLTIATHDTFKVAQRQYQWGAQNATVLQSAVMGSPELRVIRLISNTFLWLAQAQTLIRLFPRHREKVIIKWAAFALITLDIIFSALTSFKDHGRNPNPNPMAGSFDHPIPALSYLFQLLLGVLYAAWVIYYSLMKKRYAFYHPLMKNMPLVAIISLTSILIPVVFFIMDISKPEFTGWGDYVRWVGAAAASVIVWEWVERIEALEREEKKDGILGREVFDGDETLEVNASEFPWLRSRKQRKDEGGGGAGQGGADHGGSGPQRDQGLLRGNGWRPGVSVITGRQRGQARGAHEAGGPQAQRSVGDMLRPPQWPARPAPAVTPVSRTDTPSVASTVYAVRYQATSDATTTTPDLLPPQRGMGELSRQNSTPRSHQAGEVAAPTNQNGLAARRSVDLEANTTAPTTGSGAWRTLTLGAGSVSRGEDEEWRSGARRSVAHYVAGPQGDDQDDSGRWDIRWRLELFAANQAEKIREKLRPTTETDNLPVTVIPAPPRRGAALQQVLEEDERSSAGAPKAVGEHHHSSGSMSSRRGASEEMAGLGRHDSAAPGPCRGAEAAAANPPLWPGVRRRALAFEGDDAWLDDGSLAETASMESDERESDDEAGGPPRAARDGGERRE